MYHCQKKQTATVYLKHSTLHNNQIYFTNLLLDKLFKKNNLRLMSLIYYCFSD